MSTSTQSQETKKPDKFQIFIDRDHFTVTTQTLTGSQLRQLPTPPIGSDRDLFEIVPGGQDLKIENDQVVALHNGQHFFTAPSVITPGAAE